MKRRLLLTLAGLMSIAATLGLVGTRGIVAKHRRSRAVQSTFCVFVGGCCVWSCCLGGQRFFAV